jgi:hypothetical protein
MAGGLWRSTALSRRRFSASQFDRCRTCSGAPSHRSSPTQELRRFSNQHYSRHLRRAKWGSGVSLHGSLSRSGFDFSRRQVLPRPQLGIGRPDRNCPVFVTRPDYPEMRCHWFSPCLAKSTDRITGHVAVVHQLEDELDLKPASVEPGVRRCVKLTGRAAATADQRPGRRSRCRARTRGSRTLPSRSRPRTTRYRRQQPGRRLLPRRSPGLATGLTRERRTWRTPRPGNHSSAALRLIEADSAAINPIALKANFAREP